MVLMRKCRSPEKKKNSPDLEFVAMLL